MTSSGSIDTSNLISELAVYACNDEAAHDRFIRVHLRPLSILLRLQHDSPPFEFCVLKINHHANLQSSDFQRIQHLSDFMVSDSLDRFRVNNDLFKTDQVRDVFPQLNGVVSDG